MACVSGAGRCVGVGLLDGISVGIVVGVVEGIGVGVRVGTMDGIAVGVGGASKFLLMKRIYYHEIYFIMNK